MMNASITLLDYLNNFGMIGCNRSKYIPSITDLGVSLNAVMELIENKEIFYSKVFMGRTVYISKTLYCLLAAIKGDKALNYYERYVLQAVQRLQPVSTKQLKAECTLSEKKYNTTFNSLLKKMCITAYSPYEFLNPHWATMLYSSAKKWEDQIQYSPFSGAKEVAEQQIINLLKKTINQQDINKMIADVKME